MVGLLPKIASNIGSIWGTTILSNTYYSSVYKYQYIYIYNIYIIYIYIYYIIYIYNIYIYILYIQCHVLGVPCHVSGFMHPGHSHSGKYAY